MMAVSGLPRISSLLYPNSSAAWAFHNTTRPSLSTLMMASLADSRMAPRRASESLRALTSWAFSEMSRMMPVKNRSPSVTSRSPVRELDGDLPAVLADSGHLDLLADNVGLAGRHDSGDAGEVIGVEPLRDDQGEGVADGLLGRVAEDVLGGRVPGDDVPVLVGSDDRVAGRPDDRFERLGVLGHVTNRTVGPLGLSATCRGFTPRSGGGDHHPVSIEPPGFPTGDRSGTRNPTPARSARPFGAWRQRLEDSVYLQLVQRSCRRVADLEAGRDARHIDDRRGPGGFRSSGAQCRCRDLCFRHEHKDA